MPVGKVMPSGVFATPLAPCACGGLVAPCGCTQPLKMEAAPQKPVREAAPSAPTEASADEKFWVVEKPPAKAGSCGERSAPLGGLPPSWRRAPLRRQGWVPESRHPQELRHRNLCAKQLLQHQMKQVQLRSYGLLESHQLKQAVVVRDRRHDE